MEQPSPFVAKAALQKHMEAAYQAATSGVQLTATLFESGFKLWVCRRLPAWFLYDGTSSYLGLDPDSAASAAAAMKHLMLLEEGRVRQVVAQQLSSATMSMYEQLLTSANRGCSRHLWQKSCSRRML